MFQCVPDQRVVARWGAAGRWRTWRDRRWWERCFRPTCSSHRRCSTAWRAAMRPRPTAMASRPPTGPMALPSWHAAVRIPQDPAGQMGGDSLRRPSLRLRPRPRRDGMEGGAWRASTAKLAVDLAESLFGKSAGASGALVEDPRCRTRHAAPGFRYCASASRPWGDSTASGLRLFRPAGPLSPGARCER